MNRSLYRRKFFQLLEKIFLLDGEFAFENKADQIYFNIQKEYLDSLKKDNKERFGSHFMVRFSFILQILLQDSFF